MRLESLNLTPSFSEDIAFGVEILKNQSIGVNLDEKVKANLYTFYPMVASQNVEGA